MKTNRSDYIANLINKNIKNSNSSGKFRKTVFHVHTPESHDYKLIDIDTQIKLEIKKAKEKNKNSWREFTSEELIKIAKYVGLLFEDHLITDIKKYMDDDYFNSENELLAFLIQGHIILKEKIEVCLVCDHNSTKGFKKLQRAIYILRKERPDYEVKPRIELGIEISCSDKNHVVGILNQNNQEQLNKFNKWMNKNIISPSEGTIRTTFDVFETFKKLGIIGYIAHINTSQIFKPEFLSGTYKKELFNSKLFKIIGVTDTDQISNTINRIRAFTKKNFNFIIDNDSHDINGLRTNFFYIKGNKMNFNSIEAALKDFDLSVSYEKITDPSRYIKAVYIEGNGFLKGEADQHMILNFSPNFNAIIGGRGTGKSTILNTIGYLTSQIFENKNILTNILNQGTCCVVYHFNGVDYYIFLFSSDDINNDIFINNYFEEKSWKVIKKNDESETDRRKRAIKDRIQVFTYDGKKTTELKSTKKILDDLFTRKFTINELVNISSNESYLTQFIQSTIYEFKKIKRKYYRFEFKEGIEGVVSNYNNIPELLEKRMKRIYQVLENYNQENSKKLRINFRQKKLIEFPINWYSTLGISIYSSDRYFDNYAITYENLTAYLEALTIQMSDGIEVCRNFWEKNYETILQYADPINYFEELKIYTVDNMKRIVENKNDKIQFLKEVRELLMKKSAVNYLQVYLKNFLENSDLFELEFNINNREYIKDSKCIFKNITQLSMGQKVVAILSFVLTFSEFTNDNSPFIVDQPEDNLDNQYIYKNLVDDLKTMKLKRQVILASHNSTIVMNSGAEQVIVMDSDNEHGWPMSSGYMADRSVVNHVINILEGGKDAFTDKAYFYNYGLKKEAKNFINHEIISWNDALEDVVLEILGKIENMSVDQIQNILHNIEKI